jgi:hypothetical protein
MPDSVQQLPCFKPESRLRGYFGFGLGCVGKQVPELEIAHPFQQNQKLCARRILIIAPCGVGIKGTLRELPLLGGTSAGNAKDDSHPVHPGGTATPSDCRTPKRARN